MECTSGLSSSTEVAVEAAAEAAVEVSVEAAAEAAVEVSVEAAAEAAEAIAKADMSCLNITLLIL